MANPTALTEYQLHILFAYHSEESTPGAVSFPSPSRKREGETITSGGTTKRARREEEENKRDANERASFFSDNDLFAPHPMADAGSDGPLGIEVMLHDIHQIFAYRATSEERDLSPRAMRRMMNDVANEVCAVVYRNTSMLRAVDRAIGANRIDGCAPGVDAASKVLRALMAVMYGARAVAHAHRNCAAVAVPTPITPPPERGSDAYREAFKNHVSLNEFARYELVWRKALLAELFYDFVRLLREHGPASFTYEYEPEEFIPLKRASVNAVVEAYTDAHCRGLSEYPASAVARTGYPTCYDRDFDACIRASKPTEIGASLFAPVFVPLTYSAIRALANEVHAGIDFFFTVNNGANVCTLGSMLGRGSYCLRTVGHFVKAMIKTATANADRIALSCAALSLSEVVTRGA